MTLIASTWLALAIVLAGFAWFADRRMIALTLPVAVIIAAGALWVPTGSPRFTPIPKGDYAIVGVKIVVDEAIYLLLDSGGVPVYYVIPYSAGKANDLQDALDAGGGKGVRVKADGEEGGETFDGPPPVTADEPKIPEAPAFAQ